MAWLQSIDTALFRFVNQTLSNPCFDWLMPMLSGFALFIPALILLGVLFVWKGGARARLCVFFLLLVTALGDGVICRTLKQATARPRPCLTLPGVRLPMTFRADRAATAPPAAAKPAEPGRRMRGCSLSGSMPSAHAANCFAAATVAFIFFRRTARLLYPLAAAVAFSRVYNGVHYPSDVLAGAVLGAGYAFAFVWATNSLWRWAGQKWLPLWWDKLPSLALTPHAPRSTPHASSPDQHWLRLGYVLIALIFFAKLAYLAGGVIELSEDEAYQWLWSKHPALSYFSKPPLIAWTQWLGTQLWGDTELGVRFFSPVIAATLGILLLRFFAREVNVRAGLALVLIINVTPLLAVGGTLLTVDPLLILFWTAALLAGWRAVQPGGTTRHWLWTGLWMGLAFLAKYSALYQWLCWAVFFALWPPARAHLRRPGPWLALVINLLCMLPVLVWNQQHDWITLAHVASNGKLNSAWHPQWKFPAEFLGLTIGLLHPVFFVAAAWAAITFWRRDRRAAQLDTTERRSPIRRGGDANLEPAGSETGAPARRRALLLFFFCMGAPVYLFHLLYTIHSRVFPNWIAPAVLPLFCLMVVYWEQRWREGARAVRTWLVAGVASGLAVVVLLHDTDLIQKITQLQLPARAEPLRRVRGWKEVAATVETQRQKLLGEGRPVFIIGGHYGITSELSFYLPAAKAAVRDVPLVYFLTTDHPQNQFYFWPGYRGLPRGQNALFVSKNQEIRKPPTVLAREFAEVRDLGLFPVLHEGRVLHTVQIFFCRDLR